MPLARMPLAIVLAAVFALTMANAIVYATLGVFGRAAGLTVFQIGTIFATSGVLFFLVAPAWGRIADRRGERLVIVVGLAGTAASLLLFSVVFALPAAVVGASGLLIVLLLVRALYGFLAAGAQPAATAYAVGAGTASTGAAWIGAAIGLGSVGGPAMAAWLVDFGYWLPSLIGGGVAVLAAAGTLLAIDTPVVRERRSRSRRPLGGLRFYRLLGFAFYLGFAGLQPTMACCWSRSAWSAPASGWRSRG